MENRSGANFRTNEPEENSTSHDQTKYEAHQRQMLYRMNTKSVSTDYIQQYSQCKTTGQENVFSGAGTGVVFCPGCESG